MAKFHYRESPSETQKKAFAPYLSEDEELVLVTGLSKAYIRNRLAVYFLFPGMIFGAIVFGATWMLRAGTGISLLLALISTAVVAALYTMLLYHANRYLFTTRRVIIKRGLFSVKLTAALFDKITHLEVDQAFFDRLLFHHGAIIINTAGLNKGEIVLKYVDYPMELKNLLERLINREREQFGLRGVTLSSVEGEIVS